MFNQDYKKFILFTIAIILTLGLSIAFQSLLAAYTAPLNNPPTCLTGNPGCDPPISSGSALIQQTQGALWIVNSAYPASPYGLIVEQGNVGIGTTNPGAKLEVQGEVKSVVSGADFYMVPKGAIIMWSGTLAAIPSGWALCDGTNGTPDLRDKFIYGVSASENPGATGGATTHYHGLPLFSEGSTYMGNIRIWFSPYIYPAEEAAGAKITLTENWPAGSAGNMYRLKTEDANSLPPYYKIAFIMRL